MKKEDKTKNNLEQDWEGVYGMEEKIKELAKRLEILEWKIIFEKKEEKPNGFQLFALGFSIASLIAVLLK